MGSFGTVVLVAFVIHFVIPTWIVLTRPIRIRRVYALLLLISYAVPITGAIIRAQDAYHGEQWLSVVSRINEAAVILTWLIAIVSVIHARNISKREKQRTL